MAAIEERSGADGSADALTYDYVHTGPDTLAGRYLRRFWQPVMVADQLPAGRAKPIKIMNEDFTLYRGETGQAHLVAFRCAHRGTQLSTGWVESDEIRCFYHGWKYDGAGQCTDQPAEPEPFCNRIRIKGYPTEEYLGLIWSYLGEGEAPLIRRFPQLEQESETDIRATIGGQVNPYCYVNNLENDPAHVPFVHRDTQFFVDMPQVTAQEMEYGSQETVTFSNRFGYVQRIMPNTRLFTVPVQEGGWTEFMLWLVPVDDESHRGFGVLMNHVKPEAVDQFRERVARLRRNIGQGPSVGELSAKVLRGEGRIEDFANQFNVVNLQDTVSQWGQGTIRDRAPDRLGRSDAGVVVLRSLWERELRNLAEGWPLKEWSIPERIALTPDYHG
jgi:5,5'-dehydrodivanillate O-demethylase oxygenase subunit